jgi:uncharacterized protein (DUF427 family)
MLQYTLHSTCNPIQGNASANAYTNAQKINCHNAYTYANARTHVQKITYHKA